MTATDLFRLRFVGDVVVSRDGSQVACTVTHADGDVNRNRTSIWVVPVAGGEARQVTSGEKRDTGPAWSPDGTKIAFASDRGKKNQIFILDLAHGGEATQLTTDEEHAASEPIWSPDGATIAFLCRVPSVPEPVHNVEYKDDADKPKIITRAKYKYDGEGFFDHTRKQLFVIPATGGDRAATDQRHDGRRPDRLVAGWHDASPSSPIAARTRITTAIRTSGRSMWRPATLTQVTPHDGEYGSPAWSPDGASLAFVGHRSRRRAARTTASGRLRQRAARRRK